MKVFKIFFTKTAWIIVPAVMGVMILALLWLVSVALVARGQVSKLPDRVVWALGMLLLMALVALGNAVWEGYLLVEWLRLGYRLEKFPHDVAQQKRLREIFWAGVEMTDEKQAGGRRLKRKDRLFRRLNLFG